MERLRRPRRPGRGRATAVFQRVPEGKSAKNRVHLDLNIGATVSDPEQRRSVVRQRSEQLADAGGSVLREVDEYVTKTVCALLDKHGAVTRPRDGIPLAGSEGHRARRARHPCVGRCPSERVIHLTARE